MNIKQGNSPDEVVLQFDSPEQFEQFFDEAEKAGSFQLEISELPPSCYFVARAEGTPRSRKIRPVAIRKNGNTMVIHLTEPAETGKELSAAPEQKEAHSEDGMQELLDLISEQKKDKERRELSEPQPEEVGKSLFEKIRSLTVTERVTLALKADLLERRILVQENNSKINEFLLKNPRMSEQEIAQMARNPGVPLQNLLAIAGNRIWMSNDAVRVAVLTNPRTPPAMVLEMIPSSSSGDLTRMFQSPYLREDIRGTVRRELKRRGVKIRETPP